MALAAPEAKGAPHPTGALHHELESDRIATRTDLADSARSRGPGRPCRVSRRLFLSVDGEADQPGASEGPTTPSAVVS
jgi:hypothetical protein